MAGKRKAEAKRWFQQASYDLQAVRWNMEGGFYDTACFLAQQAGEKALKSLLYYLGARRVALLTHSLLEMVQEAAKKVKALERLFEEARNRNSDGPLDSFFHFPHQRRVYESGKGSTEQERFIQRCDLLALGRRSLV